MFYFSPKCIVHFASYGMKHAGQTLAVLTTTSRIRNSTPAPPALRIAAPTFETISPAVKDGTEGDPPPPSASLMISAETGLAFGGPGFTVEAAEAPLAPNTDPTISNIEIAEYLFTFLIRIKFLRSRRLLSSRRN
jgi:hypothetical protein